MDLEPSSGKDDWSAYILYVTEDQYIEQPGDEPSGCFLTLEWFRMVNNSYTWYRATIHAVKEFWT